ncbi:hypothetical protein Bca101_102001 [Brassica carinata]
MNSTNREDPAQFRGVMTMAQKEKPKEKPLVSPCTEVYLRGPGRGKCDATSCKSECARKRKGIGLCYNNEITDPTTQNLELIQLSKPSGERDEGSEGEFMDLA